VTTLDYLLKSCTPNYFTKNDIYSAIKKRDLHVNLTEQLLVDHKTTQIFTCIDEVELNRLLHLKPKSIPTAPITVNKGSKLRWGKTEYEVSRASSRGVELQTGKNTSKLITADLFIKLIQQSEIELSTYALDSPIGIPDRMPERSKCPS